MVTSSCGVDAEENEEEDCEAPERRSSVAEEGKWNAYDRAESYDHADIDGYMEYEIRGYAVSVDPAKHGWLPLGYVDHTEYEQEKQSEHGC